MTNLDNNPGILPVRLGNVQNIADYWSFIQIFDISEIIKEFIKLQQDFHKLENSMKNETTYITEFYNSFSSIKTYKIRITNQLSQLNPKYNINREKRGLINGLGSIIKSLTGNLDEEDAERYDRAINHLINNQNKMKSIVKEQISILHESTQDFKQIATNLTHNQKVLENRIAIIQESITKLTTYNFHFALIQATFSQMLVSFQIIYDTLEKLETAITFSKLNIFHNSIVEPRKLLKAIQSISKEIKGNKLPFSTTLENILKFEKILEIKSYIKENQVVFIIDVPIVEKENYAYYHLYGLPTPSNSDFKMIIPRSKYLILNERKYAFSENKCKEVNQEEFICYETNSAFFNNEMPCEIQILKFSKNISSCYQIPLKLRNVKIQKIEDYGWIIISPKETIGIKKCGSSKENLPFKGTHLVKINPDCELQIENFQLRTQLTNSNFQDMELPNLKFEYNFQSEPINFEPLALDSVNLEDLNNIQNKLNLQNTKLNSLPEEPVYFKKLSIWTIFLYFVLVILMTYFIYIKIIKPRIKKEEEHNEDFIV